MPRRIRSIIPYATAKVKRLGSGGVAPANTVAPAITGTTTIGQLLSVSDGTWLGSPTSYAYQWKRGGADIGSATNNTYTLVTADVGYTITCTVTATNGSGGTAATSAATTVVLFDVSLAVRWWSPRFGDMKQNSNGTTDVALTDDPIGYIPDRSASADHALQATAGNKGRYKPTGLNGYPGIDVVTDDYFTFTSLVLTNFTIFSVVMRNGADSAVNYIVGGVGQGAHIGGTFSTPNAYGVVAGSGQRRANENPTTAEIFTFANAKLWKNGVEATYSATGTPTGMTVTALACRSDLTNLRVNGVFGDIVICNSTLSDADRDSIGRYLAASYGKTWGN